MMAKTRAEQDEQEPIMYIPHFDGDQEEAYPLYPELQQQAL
jgi:hypothetical protein